MSSVDPSMITDAVVALLRENMTCPVGDGQAPLPEDDDLKLDLKRGFAVVYRIPSGGRYEGSSIRGTEATIERIRFQVSTAGVQRNQVERLANAAGSMLTDRGDSGEFVFPMPVGGHSIMNRKRVGDVPYQVQGGSHQSGILVDLLVCIV